MVCIEDRTVRIENPPHDSRRARRLPRFRSIAVGMRVVRPWVEAALPLLAAALALSAASPLFGQGQVLRLQNPSPLPRIEWAKGTVPFPPGRLADPGLLEVGGRPTSWRVLQRWPDGSLRLAQARWIEVLPPHGRVERRVGLGPRPLPPFRLHPSVAARLRDLRIVTTIADTDLNSYLALYAPAFAPGTVLEANPPFMTFRGRTHHYPVQRAGIGRDFLSQTCYLTFVQDLPYAYLDLVIGNDYRGADLPVAGDPDSYALGDVGFHSLDLTVLGAEALPCWAEENGLRLPILNRIGRPSSFQRLLSSTYLGDGQTKRWRFILFFDDPRMPWGERRLWLASALAQADEPLLPIASHRDWKTSYAAGLHGGPVRGPSDARARALREYAAWKRRKHFGPFGSYGDLKESYVTGTPRNGPMTELFAHGIQTGLCLPLIQLEGQAFQQSLRPIHLWGLRILPTDDIYMEAGLPYRIDGGRRISKETLGRLALFRSDPWKHWRRGVPVSKNHGWNAYDLEHFSLDILYDHWVLTGDHRDRDEIAALAEGALGGTRPFKYFPSKVVLAARAEGWIAQALVKAWLVTGDRRYRAHLLDRIHRIVEPLRRKTHPSRALTIQRSHPATGFPTPHEFYMPWQHAAVVHGYMAVWRWFGDPVARKIAHDVLTCVIYAWVRNYKDPKFGLVRDGLRYFVPTSYKGKAVPADAFDRTIGVRWGDGPLGGAHTFLIGAMDLLREDPLSPQEYVVATYVREALLGPMRRNGDWRWRRWSFLR